MSECRSVPADSVKKSELVSLRIFFLALVIQLIVIRYTRKDFIISSGIFPFERELMISSFRLD